MKSLSISFALSICTYTNINKVIHNIVPYELYESRILNFLQGRALRNYIVYHVFVNIIMQVNLVKLNELLTFQSIIFYIQKQLKPVTKVLSCFFAPESF